MAQCPAGRRQGPKDIGCLGRGPQAQHGQHGRGRLTQERPAVLFGDAGLGNDRFQLRGGTARRIRCSVLVNSKPSSAAAAVAPAKSRSLNRGSTAAFLMSTSRPRESRPAVGRCQAAARPRSWYGPIPARSAGRPGIAGLMSWTSRSSCKPPDYWFAVARTGYYGCFGSGRSGRMPRVGPGGSVESHASGGGGWSGSGREPPVRNGHPRVRLPFPPAGRDECLSLAVDPNERPAIGRNIGQHWLPARQASWLLSCREKHVDVPAAQRFGR